MDIKRDIHLNIGVPPSEQRLLFDGHMLEDDARSLMDYHIYADATLRMIGIYIHVVTLGGETLTMEVAEDSGISYVAHALELAHGILAIQQRLCFAGQLLDSGRTLADYKIVKGSTINLGSSQLPPLMPS